MGLEPTTLCLEGKCSIQLSYRHIFLIRTTAVIISNLVLDFKLIYFVQFHDWKSSGLFISDLQS